MADSALAMWLNEHRNNGGVFHSEELFILFHKPQDSNSHFCGSDVLASVKC
jgi:hypothetical protein